MFVGDHSRLVSENVSYESYIYKGRLHLQRSIWPTFAGFSSCIGISPDNTERVATAEVVSCRP